jgi:formate/nitrite transporter FocA (FNT family)
MKKLFADPNVRLAVRAIVAGLAVSFGTLKTGHHIDKAALDAAAVAGGWAFVEAFTPLNAIVGSFKSKP